MYYKSQGKFKFFLFIFIFLFLPLVFGFYYIYKRQVGLINYLENVVFQKNKEIKDQMVKGTPKLLPGEGMGKTWLDVQNQIKDTVVQIFTQIDKFNWFEPYKTPEQGEAFGSGFFIDNKGYIVTNFHVVNAASKVRIQIPSFGREQFDVEIVGVCPDRDIALLKLTNKSLNRVKRGIKNIPFLKLGDSDAIVRTQEVMAVGYPLGQERLKSTLGIVSGREQAGFIQITSPINPGNSGGPCLNAQGEVVGINFAGVLAAQNVGYIIPINEIKNALLDLRKVVLLRKPRLGCIFTVATSDMVKYLKNPLGGGWYIAEVFKKGILDEIGVQEHDMLYEVNGYRVDMYGELSVPWSEDKVALLDFLNRFTVGDDIHFVIYRKGERKDFRFKLTLDYLPSIRTVYPEFEPKFLDYEVIGGMVIMQLTLNHVAYLVNNHPGLAKYLKPEMQIDPALLITHILPNSQARRTRVLAVGSILDEVNNQKVKTLNEFRDAVLLSKRDGFLTISTQDNMFAALPVEKILKGDKELSRRYFYKSSKLLELLGNKEENRSKLPPVKKVTELVKQPLTKQVNILPVNTINKSTTEIMPSKEKQ